VVIWVLTPCSKVTVYQRFEGPCCLHLLCEEITLMKSWGLEQITS
jgi:hypothetical protein